MVKTYRLPGVTVSEDLKLNYHVDYIVAKVAKRLYTLRILKRAGLEPKDILKLCISNVRSTLECAIQVWPDIPVY